MSGRWIQAVLLAAGLACYGAGLALAQTVEQQGYRSIDQLRDDVDPLSRSLRQSETGLSVTGERQNVYRSASGSDNRFYYIAPGVLAEFDRSDYALTREGGIVQLAPPNLVYHIGRPRETPPTPPRVASSDRRVMGRVEARLNGEVVSSPLFAEPVVFSVRDLNKPDVESRDRRPRSAWDNYHTLSTVMRMMVVGALGRQERTGVWCPPGPSDLPGGSPRVGYDR